MANQKPNRREVLTWGVAAGLFAALLPQAVAAETMRRTPLLLALPDFVTAVPSDRDMARKMVRLVASDLRHSGRSVLVGSSNVAGTEAANDGKPRFAEWAALNAQALVTGGVAIQRETLRSEIRLWDVTDRRQLMAKLYVSAPQDWRRISHNMAQSIREALSGSVRQR